MKSNKFTNSTRVLALVVFAMSVVAPQPAAGVTFWVTNKNNSDPGSLPWAVADANGYGSGTIMFSNVTGTITLTNTGLELKADVTIIGPGAEILAISGNNRSPVFKIPNHTVVISGLTIRDGQASDALPGGGVYNQANLTLVNCIIRDNRTAIGSLIYSSGPPGGGIGNYGTLTMSNCIVRDNHSAEGVYEDPGKRGGHGGGLYNAGNATLMDCSMLNNATGSGGGSMEDDAGASGGSGGGIYNAGVLSLTRCTLSGNGTGSGGNGGHSSGSWHPTGGAGGWGGSGGAIYNAASVFLTNCTISGNGTGGGGAGAVGGYCVPPNYSGGNGGNGGAGGNGGGICNAGSLTLFACTISANGTGPGGIGGPGGTGCVGKTNGAPGSVGSAGMGGGIYGYSAGTVFNSIIAQNAAAGGGPDLFGSFTSLGYNLIANSSGSTGFGVSGDILNVDALLGPLADNGGPTYTMALLPGSPAIDRGNAGGVLTDQRGLARPFDFFGIPNESDGSDIGSFEVTGMFLVTNTSGDQAPGSLRQALSDANAMGGGNIIFSNISGTIALGAELVVTQNVSINGPGADLLAVSGNNLVRVFNISSHAATLISGLTIRDGSPPSGNHFGGGILNNGSLTLVNCVIANNKLRSPSDFGYGGGGVANFGTLTISNSVLCNNDGGSGGQAYHPGGDGGALYNSNNAVLLDCTIRNNTGGVGGFGSVELGYGPVPAGRGGHGGGVYNAGNLSLVRCTLSGNASGSGGKGGNGLMNSYGQRDRNGSSGGAGGDGGAIYNQGTLAMTNCTFSGNTSGLGGVGGTGAPYDPDISYYGGNGGNGGDGGFGGGIMNVGNLTLYAITSSGNSVGLGGLGGAPGSGYHGDPSYSGTPGRAGYPGVAPGINGGGNIYNSIVNDVLSGSFTSIGYNLIHFTNWSTGFGVNGDILNVDPLLGPLADNGGPTYTMALLPGSPAIDRGNAGDVVTDQRGSPRPYDFADLPNASDGADMGAFEVIGPAPAPAPAPAGLASWWPGEGSAWDVVGTNHGTVQNGTTYSAGKVGLAFSFDGIDDHVSGVFGAFSNRIANNFTMEFWAYPSASRASTAESTSGAAGVSGQRYAILPAWGGFQKAGAGVSVGTNGISVFEHGDNYLAALLVYNSAISGWTHVAVVYTNKQPSLYVNGILTRTGLTSVRTSVFPSTYLGGGYYGYFAGMLDEVSIYDRALSAGEVASVYTAGMAGKYWCRSSIQGWPANATAMTGMPLYLTNLVSIAAGTYHSLALRSDGTVLGWGENDFGQTQPPAGLTNVTAIAAGWGTSLALKRDGTLAAWGWDGGYGLKSTAESLTNISAVSACWDCLMALKRDGTVLVWGKSTHDETNVPAGLTDVTAIAGGGVHCLALKSDGTVVAWGDNGEGQLNVPAGLSGVVGIAAGGHHSLALRPDGTVVVWGKNTAGQTNVPTDLTDLVAISGGMSHSLALQSDGHITAWGDNSSGQTNVPANLTNVVTIAAGGYHNLALTGSRAPWTKFTHITCAANGQVHFTVVGLCGDVYQILASTNLVDWQCLCTATNTTGTLEFTDSESSAYSQRFYRIVMP